MGCCFSVEAAPRNRVPGDVPGIYVVTNPYFGPHYKKIGMSATSLKKRVRSYNTYSPHDYIIEAVYEVANAREVEKHIHSRLDAYRKPKNKEWFDIADNAYMFSVIESCIKEFGKT